MSFLGVKEITQLQEQKEVITPFESARIKNGAYELSLGAEIYLTDSKSGKVEYLNEHNREVNINPGQFALLLTKEVVHVPKDKLGLISIKAGEKLKGLVNVSGFHVDPGFNDHLLFSVYNAGPSTIVLSTGEPYFPIWFAELKTELSEGEAYGTKNEHFRKLDHIPAKYLEFLKRGDLASPNYLLERIKGNEGLLNNLKWAAGLLIGIGITLSVKSIWDTSKFNEGYNVGVKEKQAREMIVNSVATGELDSIVSFKVDSILKQRSIQNDTSRSK